MCETIGQCNDIIKSKMAARGKLKHRHARHARVIFLLGGGGGGHCGSNGILCFVENGIESIAFVT